MCAQTGAALVLMHTRAAPKQRLQDPDLYGDVVGEVHAFLRERIEQALALGVEPEQIILDPGPDFAKTPAQTIELLAGVGRLHELGRPLLMAVSRKDFIGALTGRPPRERLPGTLAALAHGVDAGARIFRVHDVAAAADFLKVRAALAGELRAAEGSGARRGTSLRTRSVAHARLHTQRVPVAAQRDRTPTAQSKHTKEKQTCQYSTAPSWRPARWPTSTRSPTSSASTASGACARRI